jgi:hypothetical protein
METEFRILDKEYNLDLLTSSSSSSSSAFFTPKLVACAAVVVTAHTPQQKRQQKIASMQNSACRDSFVHSFIPSSLLSRKLSWELCASKCNLVKR